MFLISVMSVCGSGCPLKKRFSMYFIMSIIAAEQYPFAYLCIGSYIANHVVPNAPLSCLNIALFFSVLNGMFISQTSDK